jgi:site-specific DNA-methyltransferase (adenine-specific)
MFDIVIGNPPYQDGSRTIYHKFIALGQELGHITSMIVPSKWETGGKGLDGFREKMICSEKLKRLVNIPNIFEGIKIGGGLSYFIWSNSYKGKCLVDDGSSKSYRNLKQFNVILRSNAGANLLAKINACYDNVGSFVKPRNYFKISTEEFKKLPESGQVKVVGALDFKRVARFISRERVKDFDELSEYKVVVTKLLNDGWNIEKSMLRPFILEPGVVCTESYLLIKSFKTLAEAEALVKYLRTQFVRVCLLECTGSVNITRSSFDYVPYIPELDVKPDESIEELNERLMSLFDLTDAEKHWMKNVYH